MYSYFHKTPLDEDFFEKHLAARLPERILDAHGHFDLPEHVASVPPEAVAGDWAMECGLLMSYEDYRAYTAALFPDVAVEPLALPWPIYQADTAANNDYIAGLIGRFGVRGLLTIRPEYPPEEIEQRYLAGGFCGFKPYPYMASPIKSAEVGIFDFMTHEQFALADRLAAPVLMHLPRAGKLPDPHNLADVHEILARYPRLKLILAHFGRCYTRELLLEGLAGLDDVLDRLWFDCAAVVNPEVYALAFERIDYQRILFGTDFPIMLWHGKREWDARGYRNLCREEFSFRAHRSPEEEAGYTFIVYEQLRNLLDAIGDRPEVRRAVLYDNAAALYQRPGAAL